MDAPALDIPKMLPMVDGPVVVWNQVPSTYAKVGPVSDMVSLFALTTTLAFKDLSTGKTCLYDASPVRGYVSVIGRRMYGYVTLPKGLYVAELNLDDPSIPWKCE